MITQNVRTLSSIYLSRFQALLRFPNLLGGGGIYKLMRMNYEDLRKVIEDNASYCAISVFVPSEILNALSVHYLPLEPVLATASQLGIVTELGDIRDTILDFDTSCCGGQSLLALYERKIIDPPKYFIACSHMCDDSLKAFNYVARHYDVPIFNIDVPYVNDRHAVRYLAAQLESLVDFVCDIEKTTFVIEMLKETIGTSNRTNSHRHKIFDAFRDKPPVFRMFENLPVYPAYSKFGRKDVEDIYADLEREVTMRVAEEEWIFDGTCYRILWLGMIPLAYPQFLKYLDAMKFGFPMTELLLHSDFEEMDTAKPFEAISKKMLDYPLVGFAQNRIDRIVNVVEEYGIEGVIHFNHRGCMSFNGDNFILDEYFRTMNIPFLVLDGDIADKQYCSVEKMQEHIDNFCMVLEERYGRR